MRPTIIARPAIGLSLKACAGTPRAFPDNVYGVAVGTVTFEIEDAYLRSINANSAVSAIETGVFLATKDE